MEAYTSFCGLYSMNTCYVALKLFDFDFVKAAEWLVTEGEHETSRETVDIHRHCLIAQSEITGESYKTGQ